ncbi:flagellar hook-length control protein FliK [Pseudomonas sp. RIT-PI-S]|uniref:flagellar hook-length control protein FliK n=1 Tax=Pseudomonas sp. RIT-PI-S TaxID=3035295 RepID=UPI0021D92677|nr:flagellar hook-length control protein FliK [Pseudomonas sp. RIT-PI-S]
MTNEISGVAAASSVAAASRSAALNGELLKLLQSVDGVLEAGQTAKAEVLSIKQLPEDFQLLLKLTMDSGRQATVQVAASQPLAIGTPLLVTKMLSEQLSVSLAGSPRTGLTELDTSRLPVGTLLQGKVVTSLPVAANDGPPVYRAMVTLLNSALAGQTLTIDSPQPLRLGSLLSAQVQGNQALSVVQLSGRLDELAVAQQITTQNSRQASLQSLLAVIQASQGTDRLPPAVSASASALLATLPDMPALTNPDALAQAFAKSGLFLESGLLTGSLEAPEVDLKGALLRLVAQILPNLPASNSPPLNPATLATMAQAAPGFIRNALGILGQVGPRSVEAPAFPLASRTLQKNDNEDELHSLLRLASAALSRVQTHQLASLEQSTPGPHGLTQHSWQLEIPMRAFNDIVPMQVRVQAQDDPSEREQDMERDAEGNRLPPRKLWRLDLAFDLPRLGPLHVQAQLFNSNLSSQVWAQAPATYSVVQRELPWFRERLAAAGLNVGELACHNGRPPQGNRTRLEQRWVDETA